MNSAELPFTELLSQTDAVPVYGPFIDQVEL